MGKRRDPTANRVIVDQKTAPAHDGITPIPQRISVKPEFEERYRALLGDAYDAFMTHSLAYARKAIRVNTLKITVPALVARLEKDWILTPVPWCEEGFFIEYRHYKRFDIGNLPEHQLGYFYVQDPASMIPPVVLRPTPGDTVLDLCAAPGSKTTQLAMYLENKGIIVANDFSGDRLKPLGLNLQRCGIMNCLVTLRANRHLQPVFDKVLVDAPCSATGTIRRSLKALQMWSPGFVRRMVMEQRGVLEQGWKLLKPGGELVYSTCTLEPEEDEGQISAFLEKHPEAELVPISLNIKRSPAVLSFDGKDYNPAVEGCLRIGPQDNDTEGFFVAKLRKKAD